MSTYNLIGSEGFIFSGDRVSVVEIVVDASEQNMGVGETADIYEIPAMTLVLGATAEVITADASGEVDIGDGSAADGFIDGLSTTTAGTKAASTGESYASGKIYTTARKVIFKAVAALDTAVVRFRLALLDLSA